MQDETTADRVDYYRALGQKHREHSPGMIRYQQVRMAGRSAAEIAAYRQGAQLEVRRDD